MEICVKLKEAVIFTGINVMDCHHLIAWENSAVDIHLMSTGKRSTVFDHIHPRTHT